MKSKQVGEKTAYRGSIDADLSHLSELFQYNRLTQFLQELYFMSADSSIVCRRDPRLQIGLSAIVFGGSFRILSLLMYLAVGVVTICRGKEKNSQKAKKSSIPPKKT